MMAQALGPRETFIILGLVSMIGIPIAMSLPRSDVREPVGAKREMRFRRPNAVESTMGIVALLADGLCIVTLTLLLMADGRDRLEAISIGGILLGARQVALTLAPALAGSLADRFGSKRALLGVLLSMAAGLALMTTGRVEAGFLLVCPSAAMASTLLPGVAAARPGGDRLAAISAVVTWRDLGAAVGALATGSLLTVVDLPVLYLIAPLLLLAAAWWLWMEMDRGWSRETG
jgi:predicted MFS family arabinose efflux permease